MKLKSYNIMDSQWKKIDFVGLRDLYNVPEWDQLVDGNHIAEDYIETLLENNLIKKNSNVGFTKNSMIFFSSSGYSLKTVDKILSLSNSEFNDDEIPDAIAGNDSKVIVFSWSGLSLKVY